MKLFCNQTFALTPSRDRVVTDDHYVCNVSSLIIILKRTVPFLFKKISKILVEEKKVFPCKSLSFSLLLF